LTKKRFSIQVFDAMKRSQSRRGFIKGALAGLVGGLFTLRGAEPAQAISSRQPIQQINVTIREADPRLSEEDQARYDDLETRYADDPGLTEEEESERIALNGEMGRLAHLGSVRQLESTIEAYERARVRRGNFVVICFPLKMNGTLLWLDAVVVRLRTGDVPMLDYIRQALIERRAEYESQYGDYPG
jgi:hypothetical protein